MAAGAVLASAVLGGCQSVPMPGALAKAEPGAASPSASPSGSAAASPVAAAGPAATPRNAATEAAPPFSGPLPLALLEPAPAAPAQAAVRVRFEREAGAGGATILPQVDEADWLAGWPAWLASCGALTAPRRPHHQAWEQPCARAQALRPQRGAQVREFFATHLEVYRVVALDGPQSDARDTGLVTGYYEPELEGRRTRAEPYTVPIYRLPPTIPSAPRAQLEASGQLRGQELLWLRDPVEAFFLELQGSGRVQLESGEWVRVAYAGTNGQPYRSIGRWLIEQGELPAAQVSMAAIAAWARAHPQRLRELLDQNPRVVFFREQPLAGADRGPIGTLGVALTPGVSVAVDPAYLPLGAPLLLSIADPGPPGGTRRAAAGDPASGNNAGNNDGDDARMPARLALAQDTGGAIRGPLRIDWYWGEGRAAGEIAGRQRAQAAVRLLVPRGVAPASLIE